MSTAPSTLRILLSRRMLVQLLNGFSSGLPLLLTGSTLQAWLKDDGVDLGSIGLFALVGLPYVFKFLWAPLLDHLVPRFLGRRRGWMLIWQLALVGAILGLGLTNPAASPWIVGVVALLVAFASANQDIVLDAYRCEAISVTEMGLGSAIFVNGYRLAMLAAGAGSLALADHVPWRVVYAVMAALMSVGVLTTLFAPEPKLEHAPPPTLRAAVVEPLRDLWRRDGIVMALAFVVLYKIGDQMAAAMVTPFVLDIGFSKTDLATIAKVVGMAATIGGGLAGGMIMLRVGLMRALWVFGLLQATSILTFALLAEVGKVHLMLALAVGLENGASGMGTSAFVAYMASLTNRHVTATQYALVTSLMGVPRVLIAAPTGYLAATTGWTGFFVVCAVAAIPGMLLLSRLSPSAQPRSELATA
ncbi:MAG: AmpG family muropeptide MFS transporter [Myxococcota bacterium]